MKKNSHLRKQQENLDEHIEFLKSIPIIGISDHDLLFTNKENCTLEKNNFKTISKTVENVNNNIKNSNSISKTFAFKEKKQKYKHNLA